MSRLMATLLVILLTSVGLNAQLSGTLSIPTDYASLSAFATAINAQGVGAGGVVLNVPAGYTEAVTAPVLFTATGVTGNAITIQKQGAGANPIISRTDAGTITTTALGAQGDAVIIIEGGDFITFDGIDVSATNQGVEYGYYLRKASVTNGCKDVTIKNANITMTKGTSAFVVGIYTSNNDAASLATSATGITVTSIDGRNENVTIIGNTISNVFSGIVTRGFNHTTAPYDFYDNNFTIGSAGTGNTIQNYAGNTASTAYGVYNIYYKNFTANNNTISNIAGGGSNATSTIYGIFSSSSTGSGNLSYQNNTITLNQGSISAAHGIYISGAAANLNISANAFEYGTFASTSTSYLIYSSNSSANMIVDGNYNAAPIVKTGAGPLYGYYNFGSPTSGVATISNNTFSDITLTGASTFYGIYHATSTTQGIKIQNNSVNTILGTTNTSYGIFFNYGAAGSEVSGNTVYDITTAGVIYGINLGSTSSLGVNVFNNTVNNLTSSGASNISGFYIQGGNPASIYQNRVYNLTSNNAGGSVNGMWVSGGVNISVYNNLIGDLKAPIGTSATNADLVRGINVTSTSTLSAINVYYNSIYLNATSTGANFSSAGIFHANSATATTASLDLRNNIIINESVPTGTGTTVAYRRSAAGFGNYSANSNRNLLFAGTPAANRLIFTDGTTPQQTMLGYQTAAVPRDINSFTGEAFTYGTAGSFFVSLTPTSVDYLRPVTGLTTLVESGGINITAPAITVDFSNAIRGGNAGYTGTGTAPDVGAYEFNGISPAPAIVLNSVSPGTTGQCAASARLVSATITTPSGTVTGATLNYAFNGVAQTPITMVNTSGNIWEGTIPVATPLNAQVTWAIVASNSVPLSASYLGTTYADEPLTGITASVTASNTTVCSGTESILTATLTSASTPTYTAPGAVANALTDEDLRNITITQGATTILNNTTNYNTLNGTLGTALGTAGSYSNFTGFAPSGLVAGTTYSVSATVADSNDASYFTKGVGVYIDYNRNGLFNDPGENVFISATSPIPQTSLYTFNGTFTVPNTVSNGLTRMRVVANEGAVTSPTMTLSYGEFEEYSILLSGSTAGITSVSWSDGSTVIGTSNPITVNPTTTTTYTATIISAGCTVAPSPSTTVTVNPLPSAPTALNSTQCGTQIPAASVTSTTGATTPTFKWYDAATGGNVMQTSASTTYTSNISTTTTFYVSEVNGTTGCESPRVAVTVTVATADGIAAGINNATICIGQSVTLTATNTNPTPAQSYSYTWAGTANSGVSSSTGSSITATPALPGSYTYNLSGVDGGCNAVSTISVTVNPFVASVTAVDATCNGVANGTFTLASSSCGTLPYTYSIDGGANYGSIPSNLAAGTYTVLVKDANNYTTTGQTITVGQPSLTISNPTVTNASVCLNGTSAQVGGTAATSAPTPGSITVTFDLAAQPTEVSGASAYPTVAATPNIIMTANMPALPAGATITGATFAYPGITALGGSWQSDLGFGFTGAVSAAYGSGTGAANGAGLFNYTRALAAGTISAAGGSVNVHYYDLYNDNATSAEATFTTGTAVATLTINYTTPTPATVSWWDAPTGGTQIGTGTPFETVGTSVLTNTSTVGVVTLYAQGQFGACPSPGRTAATVTINALPVVSAGTDVTVCSGTSATLAGSGATNYTWTNSVTNNTAFVPASTATYTVTGTDANGCSNTDNVLVTVNALPTVNGGTDQTICVGAQVALTATGANTYNWTNGVSNGVSFAPSTTTSYVVTGTDANSCSNNDTVVVNVNALPLVNAGNDVVICFGDSVTLSGNGAVTYTWNNGISNGTAFAVATTTTYTVTGTDANGCINTDNVIVNVNALPNVNAGADVTVCQNGQATVNASGAQTYVWTNNVQNNIPFAVPTTITLSVTGTDANGCVNTDDITITTSALPTVNAGTNIEQCGDQNVTLNATGATYYTWNNGVQNGVSFTAPFGTTSYIVTGVDTLGCSGSDIVNVTINQIPTATATAANALTLVASPSNGTFQWIDCATNTPILGATGSTFTATANGSYAVIVTTGAGCADTSDCAIIDEVGLTDLDMTRGVTVYPNPTTGDVTITLVQLTGVDAQIFDAQGKLVQTIEQLENGSVLEISDLQPGVYMIQFASEQFTTMQRIVKN